ncbi:MAG: pyridoxamine 5'-phosphate oxidase family protein [Woeseiaceae bacterium]|nr:pyridoxamine 5'-phosphate oxidase family protein [Woeseiaceae bacterium]
MQESLQKTERTTMTRHDERGSYERATAHAILDEALVAHVGFDAGRGVTVIPMTYARVGESLYLHGAVASRWLSAFEQGRDICVTVTLLDGLVLAKSAFSHSMNYRSVVLFGEAAVVTDEEEKAAAFRAFLDHLLPGRWEDCRQPDRKETNATTVLKLPIGEASIKIRSGPPKDAEKDLELDYWTGVIPLELTASAPLADDEATGAAPDYARGYRRR